MQKLTEIIALATCYSSHKIEPEHTLEVANKAAETALYCEDLFRSIIGGNIDQEAIFSTIRKRYRELSDCHKRQFKNKCESHEILRLVKIEDCTQTLQNDPPGSKRTATAAYLRRCLKIEEMLETKATSEAILAWIGEDIAATQHN